MEDLNRFQTWRALLEYIIKNPAERQRIAQAVQVNPITLGRWARNESQPRPENLVALGEAISSEFSATFAQLLVQEFPLHAQTPLPPRPDDALPSATFYANFLNSYVTTSPPLFPQALHDLIFQEAIERLDPDRVGLAISVVSCVLPHHGKIVRSLREIDGRGTPPWQDDIAHRSMFLGLESLAGASVSLFRSLSFQGEKEPFTLLPPADDGYEQSAAASPISRQSKIAGCLVVSSTQPRYFSSERIQLIEHYAHLLALAFEPHQFVMHQDIQLHLMPRYEMQIPLLRGFQQRVTHKFVQATQKNQPIILQDTYEQVWQDIEEDLIKLPS